MYRSGWHAAALGSWSLCSQARSHVPKLQWGWEPRWTSSDSSAWTCWTNSCCSHNWPSSGEMPSSHHHSRYRLQPQIRRIYIHHIYFTNCEQDVQPSTLLGTPTPVQLLIKRNYLVNHVSAVQCIKSYRYTLAAFLDMLTVNRN